MVDPALHCSRYTRQQPSVVIHPGAGRLALGVGRWGALHCHPSATRFHCCLHSGAGFGFGAAAPPTAPPAAAGPAAAFCCWVWSCRNRIQAGCAIGGWAGAGAGVGPGAHRPAPVTGLRAAGGAGLPPAPGFLAMPVRLKPPGWHMKHISLSAGLVRRGEGGGRGSGSPGFDAMIIGMGFE